MAHWDGTDNLLSTPLGSAAALDALLNDHPAARQALVDALATSAEYGAWLRQIGSDVPGILDRQPASTG